MDTRCNEDVGARPAPSFACELRPETKATQAAFDWNASVQTNCPSYKQQMQGANEANNNLHVHVPSSLTPSQQQPANGEDITPASLYFNPFHLASMYGAQPTLPQGWDMRAITELSLPNICVGQLSAQHCWNNPAQDFNQIAANGCNASTFASLESTYRDWDIPFLHGSGQGMATSHALTRYGCESPACDMLQKASTLLQDHVASYLDQPAAAHADPDQADRQSRSDDTSASALLSFLAAQPDLHYGSFVESFHDQSAVHPCYSWLPAPYNGNAHHPL